MPELSHFSYKKVGYSSQDESRTLGRTLGQFLLAEHSRPETDATFPRLAQLGQATSFPSDPKILASRKARSPPNHALSALNDDVTRGGVTMETPIHSRYRLAQTLSQRQT